MLAVAPGETYSFSDPTPPGVPRDEDILIRNLGQGDLNLLNPGSTVSGSSCIQQLGPGPSTIPGGGSGLLHVRLLCGSMITATATVTISHNSSSFIVASQTSIPNPYRFPLQGQVARGATYDLRLDAVSTVCAPRSATTRAT